MKIKTIEATTPEEIDIKVNEFETNHEVRATQSHVTTHPTSGKVWYTYVLFYKEDWLVWRLVKYV